MGDSSRIAGMPVLFSPVTAARHTPRLHGGVRRITEMQALDSHVLDRVLHRRCGRNGSATVSTTVYTVHTVYTECHEYNGERL